MLVHGKQTCRFSKLHLSPREGGHSGSVPVYGMFPWLFPVKAAWNHVEVFRRGTASRVRRCWLPPATLSGEAAETFGSWTWSLEPWCEGEFKSGGSPLLHRGHTGVTPPVSADLAAPPLSLPALVFNFR